MNQMNEAKKQNPALEPFKILVGEWTATGMHPYVPGKTFHGHAIFEWIEGGAFLKLSTQIDELEIPSGISLLGSDNVTKEFFIIYFDERDISRKYDVSVEGKRFIWSRHSSEFSQKMVLTVSDDGNTIVSKGKMSKNGGAWEPDLELTYTRIL
jgi:hypothetical protein